MAKAAQAPRAWQRMLSGRRLDLLDPSPVDVEIADIAHGLARVARWNGQTRGDHTYSVAQHSLLVDDIHALSYPSAPAAERLAVLLHDAPEYVIGDMISPFKAIVGGDYKAVEARLQGAIHLRFGLAAQTTQALHKRIKRCDRIAAYFEAVNLAGFTSSEAHRYFGRPAGFAPDAFDLTPLAAKRVERAFLQRFAELDKARAHAAQGAT
ncbi:MAG: HD family hydrolase [Brucellaceae bacterium]|nr:HD family hydrolase [Brucellaceae bacterium]